MSDDKKVIFSMNKVGKTLPNGNVILKDIYLSFFYGAKIGIIGLNGSGKSTVMKIIAGVEDKYQGDVTFANGYSVGYLEQEPKLDETKTVKEIVQEGAQETIDVLAEYEAVNNSFGEPEVLDNPDKMEEVREIPNGTITPKNALAFVIINCVLFIATTYFINLLCFYLSPIALFVVLGYSLTKRFTALCHLVLGVGLALAPIGAYLAVTGTFAWLPLFFSFAVLFWVSGFDIIYALQDEEFDKQQKLHSIPVLLGKKNALMLSNFLHLITASCVIYAGYFGDFGLYYWIGCALFVSLLIYQHLLVKPNDLSKVNLAFFTTNGVASVLFAVFVLLDIFIR